MRHGLCGSKYRHTGVVDEETDRAKSLPGAVGESLDGGPIADIRLYTKRHHTAVAKAAHGLIEHTFLNPPG